MTREDQAYAAAVLILFGLAIAMLVSVSKPLWAKERLLHQGVLTAHRAYGNIHEFDFSDNTTITEAGWLWKTYLHTNRTVSVLKKDGAIVVREISQPVIAG